MTVLFVNDPLLAAGASAASLDERALARTTEVELHNFVNNAIGVAAGASVKYAVTKGDAAAEIQKNVRREPVDLIVMGTHGLSGAGRLLFGSTTERVLRHAAVPVLAVARPQRRSASPSKWPGKRILAALELGPHMTADARSAAEVARWWKTALILVHVVKPTQAPRWLIPHPQDRDRTTLMAARARLERIAGALGPDLKVECHAQIGDPPEQVSALAADMRAGLVVVILRAAPGFFATPQGTTTYRILCGAGTAVLALPSRWHSNRRRTSD